MSTTPRVSVIITTYNRAALLKEAVDSVLAQTYRDFELIIADDGSTDDTSEQLAAYGERLHTLTLPHSGKPEVARNRAVTRARGSFFAFLDDDDVWHPEKLARQMDVILENESLGYTYSDCCFLQVDGSLSAPLLREGEKESDAVFENLLQGCFVHPSTVVMRRAIFETAGPFEESLGSQGDYLLWLRAAGAAPVACVPEPLVTLRRSPAGLSMRRPLVHVENAILVLEQIRQEYALTWKERIVRRRALSRFYATLGLRRSAPERARHALLQSIRLNPLQRTAWKALIRHLLSAGRPAP